MTNRYDATRAELEKKPKKWLVTGVAGFIGCNLLETLLELDQTVVGLDNFSTGHRHNLDQIEASVGPGRWGDFTFLEGDICDLGTCHKAVAGVDYVLHQAALGSVPRSIDDPITTNQSNIDGFLNMLVAARDAGVGRFVYAASSSTYGDHPDLPKVEDKIGRPLSPYAVTKLVNEVYADVFARTYGIETMGLRYFNIFGPRQDPEGAYAAVIPKWAREMFKGEVSQIYGDGDTSRDFCYIANAVQANLLAATTENPDALNEVYNIAVGERTSLNELNRLMRKELEARVQNLRVPLPEHRDYRTGDVRHSLASVKKATELLGYQPSHTIQAGLGETMDWYVEALG